MRKRPASVSIMFGAAKSAPTKILLHTPVGRSVSVGNKV